MTDTFIFEPRVRVKPFACSLLSPVEELSAQAD